MKKKLIRFDPQSDGGHLIPDDIDGIEALFSPGASSASGFEKACANRKIKVFLVDKSVEKPTEEGSLFHFTSKFIGSMTNDSFMTLDNWVESSLPNSKENLILKSLNMNSFYQCQKI